MLRTTVGQLLISQALPPALRDHGRVLDGKALQELFDRLATEHPEQYADALKKLSDVGRQVFYRAGGLSPHVDALRSSKRYQELRRELEEQVDRVLADPNLDEDAKQRRVTELAAAAQPKVRDAVYEESLAERNPLALQVLSGAKGSKMNLASLRGGDLLYADNRDQPIPFPVLNSYSQGLSPAEYFAAAFGARKGVVDVKQGVADAGYFGKLLVQAAHRLVATEPDSHDPAHAERGLPVETSDPDNEGALLSYPAGGYPRDTVLTPRVLRDLRAKGVDRIVVRSPLTGGPEEGGLYAADAGVRERGGLPGLGEQVGIAAANAVAEPISQGGLCLARGTLVRLEDGSFRAVEDVVPGELVLGCDRKGRLVPVQVLAVHDNGERRVSRYRFRVPDTNLLLTVVCTADHKLLARDAASRRVVTETGRLRPGQRAVAFDRANRPLGVEFDGREAVGTLPTFDLEVDHPDHLFVLASGLVVSNSSKHSGGIAGGAKAVSGFKGLESLVQIPKTYPGGATHAQLDGRVTGVRPAAAGGQIVLVDGRPHYVPTGLNLRVKPGDTVEAGDLLSEGRASPAELVHHKGIGEGRRRLVALFREAMRDAGLSAHRRNLEVLARGLVNHVRLTDEVGPYVPDDVVPYDLLESAWEPRAGAKALKPAEAAGLYLERPVLHHSVGTPLRPSVVRELEHFGVSRVLAHPEPPPFEPHMVRGQDALQYDPDWLTRQLGSNLYKGLGQAVARGAESNALGTSYVPALINPETSVHFGRQGLTHRPGPPIDPEALR